jgi:streptogramin lyase
VLIAFDGTIWVSNTDVDTVQRIDPDNDEVVATIDTDLAPDGLVEVDGAVWVASEIGPQLSRIDPATDTVTDTFFVSDQGAINANQIVALADGDLWLPLFDSAEVVRVAVPA